MIALALALAAGCSGTPPETMADCAALGDITAREDCRLALVAARIDDPDAMKAMIAQIPAPESRDLLRIRLTVQDPVRGATLCKDAETAPAQQRCSQVLGRPHLRSPRPE